MKQLSILIAEDEALARMDIKEMLESSGFMVCGAAIDGITAVNLAKKNKPDLAILDVKMPGIDGIEVAKILQTMNIPVILLTAYSQPNLISRAKNVSVFGYLVKPVAEKDLVPAVTIAYSRWQQMQLIQDELKNTQKHLQNQKLISHAKALLSKTNNLSIYDAHNLLLQMSMDKRITLAETAALVLKQHYKTHSKS